MEGIEACIENVDDSVMSDLSAQIITTIRKAVGLPTKAGAAHLLVSICIKKPAVMRPYSDGILKILGSAIKDKSPAVRKSYAVAVGYLCRLTTDAELVKFIGRLDGYYLGTEEEDLRSIAAITAREISKNASDRFKGVASAILPTVFYGTFDNNKDISGIWKEVWEEHTTGSSSAVKLHADEILQQLSVQMTSASWNAKKQSAAALKAVAEVMGKGCISFILFFETSTSLLATLTERLVYFLNDRLEQQYGDLVAVGIGWPLWKDLGRKGASG